MYNLPETSKEIHKTFAKTSRGTATDKDFKDLRNHIEQKKREIRKARYEFGVDGTTSKPSPHNFQPLQAIMRILDGGRR